MVREREVRGDSKRLTEGKLHVRDCENHKLIGLGINPQSKFKPLCRSGIALSFLFEEVSPIPLGRIRFRQPTNRYR